MAFGSKGLALILALCISVITTLFLSLMEGIQLNALVIAFSVSFSSGYLLGYIVLEFLIFREISRINESIQDLKETNPDLTTEPNNLLSPFRQMKKVLYSFAENKQKATPASIVKSLRAIPKSGGGAAPLCLPAGRHGAPMISAGRVHSQATPTCPIPYVHAVQRTLALDSIGPRRPRLEHGAG